MRWLWYPRVYVPRCTWVLCVPPTIQICTMLHIDAVRHRYIYICIFLKSVDLSPTRRSLYIHYVHIQTMYMYVQVVTVDWQGQGSSVSTGGLLGSELSKAALLLDVVDTCKGRWMPDRLSESRIEIGLELYTVHNICIKYLSSMCPSKLVPRLWFGAANNYSAPVYNTYKGVVHIYIHRTKLRTCKKYVIIHEPLQVVTKKRAGTQYCL